MGMQMDAAAATIGRGATGARRGGRGGGAAGRGSSASSSSSSAAPPLPPSVPRVTLDPHYFFGPYVRKVQARCGALQQVLASRPWVVFPDGQTRSLSQATERLEVTEDECFACKDGGELIECDNVRAAARGHGAGGVAGSSLSAESPGSWAHGGSGGGGKGSKAGASGGPLRWSKAARRCGKVYHDYCLGFGVPDDDESVKWCCPRHRCAQCGNDADGAMCRYCPTSLCARHVADGKAAAGWRVWTAGTATDASIRTPDVPLTVSLGVCPACQEAKTQAVAKGFLEPGTAPEDEADTKPLAELRTGAASVTATTTA